MRVSDAEANRISQLAREQGTSRRRGNLLRSEPTRLASASLTRIASSALGSLIPLNRSTRPANRG